MVRITFTDDMQRHAACPPMYVNDLDAVGEVVEKVFQRKAQMRSYLWDNPVVFASIW